MAQGAPEERPQGATTRSGQGTPKEELEPKSRQSHAQPLSATLPFFIFFLPAGNPSLPRDLAVSFSSSPRETPTFPATWPFSSLLPRGKPHPSRRLGRFFPFLPAGNPNLPRDFAAFFSSSPRETPTFPATLPFFPFFPAGNPNLPRHFAVFFPSSPRETPTFPAT